MDSLHKWFSFNKSERIAIITLLAAIFVLVLACLLRPSRKSLSDDALHNLDSLLALRHAAEEEKQNEYRQEAELHPFPFNPNTLSEEEWKQMGLTDRQIRNIMNYQAKGGRFYSKKDFGKLYTISEDEFAQLEPFIVLPDISHEKKSQSSFNKKDDKPLETEQKVAEKKVIPIVDVNTADSALLVELPQIGPFMASRILSFRDKMGGFVAIEQLHDIKGMDADRYAAISPYVRIGETQPTKIDVNRADFKSLVNHPYLSYEQVKRIFNQREKRGFIKNWDQLLGILKEEGEVNPLLEQYVKF